MKLTKPILLATIVLVAISASAQRFEVFGEYSYLHFSPSITGVQSREFNGGGGGVQINFLKLFAVKGELIAYGNTTFSVHYPTAVHLPSGGTIPAGTYTTNGDMFTFLFGPEIRIPLPRVKPFGEVLVGGSQSHIYTRLADAINGVGGGVVVASQHPFTAAFGGGLDIDASKHVGIRLGEFDYILTLYNNPLTNNSSQHNFRYCGGLILKF